MDKTILKLTENEVFRIIWTKKNWLKWFLCFPSAFCWSYCKILYSLFSNISRRYGWIFLALKWLFFAILDPQNQGLKKYPLSVSPFVCLCVYLFVRFSLYLFDHLSGVFCWNCLLEFSIFYRNLRCCQVSA